MPLSDSMKDLLLTYECPHCGHPITRPGIWFKSVSRFECQRCVQEVRIGYREKVSLYERFVKSMGASLLVSQLKLSFQGRRNWTSLR
jgi:hypothetical protein